MFIRVPTTSHSDHPIPALYGISFLLKLSDSDLGHMSLLMFRSVIGV